MKKRALILLAIVAVACSCNAPKENAAAKKVIIRPFIQQLADSIAHFNIINSESIGYGDLRNIQWKRYDSLRKSATISELTLLTDDKNGVVRCYAFEGLMNRNDSNVFSALVKHLTDTTKVKMLSGCRAGVEPVGDYFLRAVKEDEHSFKLTGSQKNTLDSFLLYTPGIKLWARGSLLIEIKPDPRHYKRLREIAALEASPEALLALSRYKRIEDKNLMLGLFENKRYQFYALKAAIQFPDTVFYQKLVNIYEQEWADKKHINNDWVDLCTALARYPCAKTLNLFRRIKTINDPYKRERLNYCVLTAIQKYPNPIYAGLKEKIK